MTICPKSIIKTLLVSAFLEGVYLFLVSCKQETSPYSLLRFLELFCWINLTCLGICPFKHQRSSWGRHRVHFRRLIMLVASAHFYCQVHIKKVDHDKEEEEAFVGPARLRDQRCEIKKGFSFLHTIYINLHKYQNYLICFPAKPLQRVSPASRFRPWPVITELFTFVKQLWKVTDYSRFISHFTIIYGSRKLLGRRHFYEI